MPFAHKKPSFQDQIASFRKNYGAACRQSGLSQEEAEKHADYITKGIVEKSSHPFSFPLFHRAIRSPFDHYHFGLDFIRPLIDFSKSHFEGQEIAKEMAACVQKKENVILFSNHQSEGDPAVISLFLEKIDPKFAEEMIYVAGHRVIQDPIAIPFSMGRNLLCIYSKKYCNHPPEKRGEKLRHNVKVLNKLLELLKEGGHSFYIAPSGGRDRKDASGKVQVAPFDSSSIEMIYLLAKKSGKPCHFHTLALSSYHIMPPPEKLNIEIGEERLFAFAPCHIEFGKEINMEQFTGKTNQEIRKKRCAAIQRQVVDSYNTLR